MGADCGQAAGRREINGMRVLLVEDTWLVALGLQSILEDVGVAVCRDHDLVDRLNERGIPVVVITGYEVLPSLADKAVTILRKPLRAEALLKTLRRLAPLH